MRGILKLLLVFRSDLSYEVGNGHRIKFWDDTWCDERPLKVVYPEITVCQRIVVPTWLQTCLFRVGKWFGS